MAIIKCKMCGGDMELSPDKTFGTCEYCGCSMTLPKLDDEQRTAAFNRGNHFRRQGEFDKALGIYERMVAENEADAEAHWCCALCRFGIEYVEDPATYEWLPTCHRASFDSFLEDVDYLAALENSDGITRRQYQKDGTKIAEVQRGILATSQNAEPYDVFISYKELDTNGQRTRDSILAQDIYYQLTEQGRRVFFSRVTLEDIPGTQYEPYIFAALNSAKVMIVVGTSAENLNAVWVKNEWSRYLSLMRKDKTKLLPCYRDMDPYDLPEQLSMLMSYDMGKIGFIQDLIRGVNKVLDAGKDKVPAKETVKETVVVQQSGGTGVDAQLQRGTMALEDHEWEKADGFFEEALNLNPKCGEAYLGKLLAARRCVSAEELFAEYARNTGRDKTERLTACAEDPACAEAAVQRYALEGYLAAGEIRPLYAFARDYDSLLACRKQQKQAVLNMVAGDKLLNRAKQYADPALKGKLDICTAELTKTLDERIAAAEAEDEASVARVKQAYAEHLAAADGQAAQLRAKAEAKREKDYLAAVKLMQAADTQQSFEDAKKAFFILKGYRDSEALAGQCGRGAECCAAEKKRAAEQAAQKKKRMTIIGCAAAAVALAILLLVAKVIIPNNKYNAAVALKDAGQYEEAIAAFTAMNGYRDSAAEITACRTAIKDIAYNEALALKDAGKYEAAIAAFEALGGYKDSREQQNELKVLVLRTAAVGDTVLFGSYEQDNNTANGKEATEWLVLAKEDSRILLISKYGLDCKPYNTKYTSVTWESSTLRSWLNNEFMNTAFTAEEAAMIAESIVIAEKNPKYSTNPGNDTKDKVFLLSITEAEKYFTSNTARLCAPTAYAKAQGAYTNTSYKTETGEAACWWWLRSPGYRSSDAARVYGDGAVSYSGDSVSSDIDCVRPALWINLAS